MSINAQLTKLRGQVGSNQLVENWASNWACYRLSLLNVTSSNKS